MQKLSVIIPAYNEENTIAQVIRAVCDQPLPGGIAREVLVVDDGSTDRTARIAAPMTKDGAVRLIRQDVNLGKAAAIRRGLAEATGSHILIQDADLEYSPASYPSMLKPLLSGEADVVYGSRFKGTIRSMKNINRWANQVSNLTFHLLYGIPLTDINTCLKLFRAEDIRGLSLRAAHFAFETEVTAKLVRKGLRLLEVPVEYEARSVAQGKKINWPKALGMYWAIIRYRFFS